MTCADCANWTRTNKGWGRCAVALNGKLFNNKQKRDGKWVYYMAMHTNVRYHTQRACKVRFKRKEESEP